MGSSYRPAKIDQDLEQLFELIRDNFSEARPLLESLKDRIEGASPDLVRAEALLHRKEVLGK